MKTRQLIILSLIILIFAATSVYSYNGCSTEEKPSYTDCTVYIGWIPFDDYDCDCRADFKDNCQYEWNSGQEDSDGDGIGDACDQPTPPPPANNPPAISFCTLQNQNIMVGETARINYAVFDPDGDSFSVMANWGDSTSSNGGSSSASHTYNSAGTFAVSITATDSRGAQTPLSCGTIRVSSTQTPPPPPPPEEKCVPPTGLNPAHKVIISGDNGFVDLSWNGVSHAVSYNVRLDDGTGERYDDPRFSTCGGSPHYYCENGITSTRITSVPVKAGRTYTFWVDSIYSPPRNYCNGGTSFSVEKILPPNSPPVIHTCNPSTTTINLGETATVYYLVTDPDGDSFSVLVEWGDGTTSAGGTSSASHVYTSAGKYQVRVHATDSKGAATGVSCGSQITVNPSGTGNKFPYGWLDVITPGGIILGWALDKDRPSESIDVHIYFDGPAGSGTFIAGVNANLYRADVNQAEGVTGNHGYNFPVPDRYRDGNTHSVWVYGIDRDDPSGNSNRQLFGVPKTFRFDRPSNRAPVIHSCNPRSGSIILGRSVTIE